MRAHGRVLVALALSFSSKAFGATPIDASNWLSHPAIKEIRAIVAEVQDLQSRHVLVTKTREFEYCEPYQDVKRAIAFDGSKVTRYYEHAAGSDDSAVTWRFYYDRSGALRFAFITAGAANGTKIEHRIYFDERGHRIWEVQKLIEGPGYTFPHERWPEEDIVRNPVARFDSRNACHES